MSIFKNRTVIGVICILLALVICFGITPLFNQSISQKAEIVRVTKDIHAGELITKDMVTTAEVGSYNLPSGLMTAKDNVVGKYAKADLAVGDYILAAKLSDAPAAENAYLYNLDGTKQAISVTIKSFATGLSGKLQSGDIVSVIVADYPEDGETTIPAELQYVEIISVTASTGYDANTGEATGEEKELPSTVTFLVLPEQAKVLAELEQVAKLHLPACNGKQTAFTAILQSRPLIWRNPCTKRSCLPIREQTAAILLMIWAVRRRRSPPYLPESCPLCRAQTSRRKFPVYWIAKRCPTTTRLSLQWSLRKPTLPRYRKASAISLPLQGRVF